MKLSALTRIDGIKLNTEKEELSRFIADQRHLLSSPQDLDKTLIEALNIVSEKFGDARRTKITNVLGEEEEPEEIQEKDIAVLRYDNTIKIVEMPLKKNLKPQEIYYTTKLGTLTLITDAGKMYNISLSKLKIGKEYKINEIVEIGGEHPRLLIDTMSFNAYQSITCITRKGYIKKSHISEYLVRSKKGTVVIKLEESDCVVAVILSSDEDDKVVVISNNNYYNCYPLSEISYTGRATKGVKAIKLVDTEYVKDAFMSGDNIYKVTGRAVKGVKNG
jgi:DNA gyrase subunit A